MIHGTGKLDGFWALGICALTIAEFVQQAAKGTKTNKVITTVVVYTESTRRIEPTIPVSEGVIELDIDAP